MLKKLLFAAIFLVFISLRMLFIVFTFVPRYVKDERRPTGMKNRLETQT
jgi:hypothetical protein